jgi:hypothetical protein
MGKEWRTKNEGSAFDFNAAQNIGSSFFILPSAFSVMPARAIF